jgi:hypothetical protein
MTTPAHERAIRAEAILSIVNLVEATGCGDWTEREAILDALLKEPPRDIIRYLAEQLAGCISSRDLAEWRSIALEIALGAS